jgi:glycoside/pentoside/hexuronide:cation symporter, GPH family
LLLVIATLFLAACAAFAFTRFPFGKAEHEARLAKLAVAAAANTTSPAGKS